MGFIGFIGLYIGFKGFIYRVYIYIEFIGFIKGL